MSLNMDEGNGEGYFSLDLYFNLWFVNKPGIHRCRSVSVMGGCVGGLVLLAVVVVVVVEIVVLRDDCVCRSLWRWEQWYTWCSAQLTVVIVVVGVAWVW